MTLPKILIASLIFLTVNFSSCASPLNGCPLQPHFSTTHFLLKLAVSSSLSGFLSSHCHVHFWAITPIVLAFSGNDRILPLYQKEIGSRSPNPELPKFLDAQVPFIKWYVKDTEVPCMPFLREPALFLPS